MHNFSESLLLLLCSLPLIQPIFIYLITTNVTVFTLFHVNESEGQSQALFQQGGGNTDVSSLLTKPCFCKQEEANETISHIAHHYIVFELILRYILCTCFSGLCHNAASGFPSGFYGSFIYLFIFPLLFSSLLSPTFVKIPPTPRQVPQELKSLIDHL